MTGRTVTGRTVTGRTVTGGVQPEVRVLKRATADVGEGPVSSPDGRSIHWVDIFRGAVHTTSIADGHTTSLQVQTLVGAVALRESGGFVAATKDGLATISPDGELRAALRVLPDGIRMNDAKCDSAGRFWAGSTAMDFAAGQGALHVLRPDWTTDLVLDGLTQPNGLGWSPDDRTFYLVDTACRTLTAWDFDVDSGRLSSQRILLAFDGNGGVPDGLTVDRAGDIWLAMWGGGQLLRISPAGAIRQRIELPVQQPSSCAFGGANFDLLVVTSAAQGLPPDEAALDGSVLAISGIDARGRPSARFAG